MKIVHNTYEGGRVQSIGFVVDGKVTMTIGLVFPGKYEFEAKTREAISVTSGELEINGTLHIPGGPLCEIEPGGAVKFVATVAASYLCTYG